MTRAEWLELALVPSVGMAVWLLGERLPASPRLGALLLVAACLLLLQGLVRDLYLLSRQRRQPPAVSARAALCLCAESTLGVLGVVAGLVLLGSPLRVVVPLDPLLAGAMATTVLAVGFAIRNLVVDIRPLRIRHEPDHLNLIVGWPRRAGQD